MFHLVHARFATCMNGGYKNDTWALFGEVLEDGRKISTSTPVKLDRENQVVTTKSGSQYKIEDCDGDMESLFKEIETVIDRGFYERF